MSAPKTQSLPDLDGFLTALGPDRRRDEALRLITLFRSVTGWQPRLYTGGMIGFGTYDYRYDSGHSGQSLATGFAPRKTELSLYILQGQGDHAALLARLGPHRMGKACLYLRHLDDADPAILSGLIRAGLADLGRRWPIAPT